MWYGTANTRLTTGTFLYLLTWHITKINNKNLVAVGKSAGKSAIFDKKDALTVLKKISRLSCLCAKAKILEQLESSANQPLMILITSHTCGRKTEPYLP